jgi:hypothetical protein
MGANILPTPYTQQVFKSWGLRYAPTHRALLARVDDLAEEFSSNPSDSISHRVPLNAGRVVLNNLKGPLPEGTKYKQASFRFGVNESGLRVVTVDLAHQHRGTQEQIRGIDVYEAGASGGVASQDVRPAYGLGVEFNRSSALGYTIDLNGQPQEALDQEPVMALVKVGLPHSLGITSP